MSSWRSNAIACCVTFPTSPPSSAALCCNVPFAIARAALSVRAAKGTRCGVLAVGYPKGVMRHISLAKEQVPQVRRQLKNFYRLKDVLEQICEVNQQLLRPEPERSRPARRSFRV